MNKKAKAFWIIWIGIQGCLLLICLLYYGRERRNYTLPAEEFQSKGIYFDDFLDTKVNGFYIDSSFETTPKVISTGSIVLPAGCYQITMHYVAEGGPHTYTLDADKIDFRLQTGNCDAELKQNSMEYSIVIWNNRKLENFHIDFDYKGDGYILIGNVEIVEKKTWLIGLMGFLLLIFAGMDWLLWKKDMLMRYFSNREHRLVWLGCCFIILFSSLLLFFAGIHKGHDLEFHLLRIEGVKDGLLSRQFPVKIQPNWMNGYGYGASIFYGDIFLYFPAFLRLCNISIQNAYKLFVFAVNAATCLISYYSFTRFTKSRYSGLLGSFLYTTSVYRLVCIYVRAAVGEYLAMTFLPLFFVGIYEILFRKEESGRLKGWQMAALGYVGIVYSHLITSDLVAIFTVFIGLAAWKYTFKKDTMQQIMKCGVTILVCSVAFWVPFLTLSGDSYWLNKGRKSLDLQDYGVTFSQLFSLFPNGDGKAYALVQRVENMNEMSYSLGGGFIAAVVLFLFYWVYYLPEKDEEVKQCICFLGLSGVAVWMTTLHFPWNSLWNTLVPLRFLIQNIQFSWRLLGIASLWLSLFSIMAVKIIGREQRYKIAVEAIVVGFAVLSSGYLFSDRLTEEPVWYIQNVDNLDTFHYMGGEYIPAEIKKTDFENMNNSELSSSENLQVVQTDRSYNVFRISCQSMDGKAGYIDLPLLYYKGYRACDTDTGEELSVVKADGKVRVMVPEGYQGNLSVRYREYWYWRLAEIVSLSSVIGLFGSMLVRRTECRKMRNNSSRSL